jgi:hypothetical protein
VNYDAEPGCGDAVPAYTDECGVDVLIEVSFLVVGDHRFVAGTS